MTTVFSKRIIAYVLDFLIVSAVMWLISYLLFLIMGPKGVYQSYNNLIYVVPILIMLYFVFCEKRFGSSMGKAIMQIEVRSRNGARISWTQAILRNLTKIYWIPIVFDWLIGRLLRTDRLFNNLTNTVVIDINRRY